MITFVLLENHLTTDPDDYMAVVQPSGTATQEDVIEHIIQQGSTVTRADILSVIEDHATAVIYLVLDGKTVTTPLANFGVAIKGVFDGKGDSFDPSRHQLRGTVNAGKRYRKEVPNKAKTGKAEARLPAPNPEEYNDLNTGERNGVLTSAGMGQNIGHRLKFDPADDNQSIFFVAEDGSATKVEVAGRNKPAELMFLIPTLASGDYQLEVRAAVYDSQQVRTGTLPMTLTVS